MTVPSSACSGDHGLAVLGWDAGWADAFADLPGAPGRVGRVDRGRLRVLTGAGELAVVQPVEAAAPVTGDWVACAAVDGELRVAALTPRRTALVRRDPADAAPRPQTLAANMDEVWVLHAVDQPLRAGWLDRALVIAYESGARPVVVVTKRDLSGADQVADEVAATAPTTSVVTTSSADGVGLGDLARRLAGGRCAALLGRSGAGKSALINALAGTAAQRTAAVRPGDARGRHTTTRRSLVVVAGGSVIDTPGVRALGLWRPDAGLAAVFPDIAALASDCRFADCSHRHEPGCAVLAARERGDLASRRYARFVTLSD